MKIAELYDKFVLKYGQDTMKVPVMDFLGKSPTPVEEIPSTQKAPSIDSKPSYDDVYMDGARPVAPEKAIITLLHRFDETQLFTPVELQNLYRISQTKGPKVAFKEIYYAVQKRLFAAETCIQIMSNNIQHFK